MCHRHLLLATALLCSFAAAARADDAYYRVAFKDLDITEGKLPEPEKSDEAFWREIPNWRLAPMMRAYAVIDGKGEAFIRSNELLPFAVPQPVALPARSGDDDSASNRANVMFIRAPSGADVTGLLFMPKPDYSGMVRLKFKVAAKLANDKFAKAFYQQKSQHYQSLLSEGIPGGAWFRHEMGEADRELGKAPGLATPAGVPAYVPASGGGFNSVENTFDLFSGGRAIAENLQLERTTPMPTLAERVAPVDISTIDGITIAAIDWKKLTKDDAKSALDPLASFIPADQHAVFFPSFAKLMEVADHADDLGTRLLQLADPRSEDARTKQRYERQLCLSTSALSRLLGPALVKSVAITGSDPYFVSGTDVAALFEPANPDALIALLTARVALGASAEPTAKPVEGKVEGVAYRGFRSPDRKISSYIARLGNTIVVTNSLAQLDQLAKAQQQKLPTIASLPEYRFFRTRYARGAADESAFIFLSDATIRRWCGPRWRIASSRRVRDQAVMSELQATYLDDLANRRVQPGPIHTDLAASDVGELRLGESGVTSSVLGSLDFQTPIIDIPLEKVTQQEADFYKRWRDTYQQNWSWSFDPIGLVITTNNKRLAGDLTVMPLILNTEYRQFLSFTQGAEIKPGAGDPHDALAHWIVAFNREAPEIRQAGNMLQSLIQAKANPLSWVGSSIAVYADDDPFWAELAKQPDDREREKFLEKNFARLPVALHLEVASPLKLTAFIVALRGMVEQTAPGMVVWESLTYHDQPYVKISPTERARGELPPGTKEPALFYSISGDALIVTLHEDMLKRAIDRQTERHAAKADGKPLPAGAKPWLGSSVDLQFDQKAISLLSGVFRNDYQDELRLHSWNNLPILTEWKHRYPNQDPVALHERFFQTRLVCPGGGKYVWNDKWQTMESTVYGHPGEPKKGPDVPFVLSGFSGFNFGLTFEEHGLRAKLDLPREAADRGRGSGVGGQGK
jgi:hypothetical protein